MKHEQFTTYRACLDFEERLHQIQSFVLEFSNQCNGDSKSTYLIDEMMALKTDISDVIDKHREIIETKKLKI